MKDENPFKQKLYHHTMPVSDGLWNRIELQLPVVKKRFPFFWFTLASAVLVSVSILVWPDQGDPSKQDNLTPEKNSVPALPSNPDDTDKEVSLNSKSELESPIVVENNSPTNSNQNSLRSKPLLQNNKSKTGNNNYKISNETLAENNLINPLSSNSTLASGPVAIRSATYNYTTSLLPFDGISLVESDEALLGIFLIKPDPSCYKFTGQEKKSNLSLDVFAGPGFSPRTLEPTSTEAILYSEARNATEQGRYAWAGGARINLNLNDELAVRIGIMYEQIGDVFDYTDTLATKQSTQIDSFFAADGSFLYTETNTILIFGTLIKKIHNRYHHLDIPLLASYELPMGRATLMLNAGPVINLISSARGQILDPMLVPQYLTAGEPNQLKAYKNNLGLSVYLGAGALIPFNKNFSGLIEPRFLYRIKPVTIDSYPIKEHRHFGGINLGIRYHFD